MFDDRGPSKIAFGLPTRRARPGNGPGGGANVETFRQWLGSNSLIVFPLAIPLTRTVDPEGPLASLLGAHRLAVPQSGVEQAAGRDEHARSCERPHINPPWIPDVPHLAAVQVVEVPLGGAGATGFFPEVAFAGLGPTKGPP